MGNTLLDNERLGRAIFHSRSTRLTLESKSFAYDSFGNVRSQSGGLVNSNSSGGDFRFQGQWLESATGIYHFRARDYDSKTGTFLSRDPVDPTEQQPEALNPYQAMYNNPYIYSDPTGMFTMAELTTAENIQKVLQGIQNELSRRTKDYLIDKAKGIAGEAITSVSKSLSTSLYTSVEALEQSRKYLKAGQELEDIMTGEVCNVIGSSYQQYLEYLWIQPRVSKTGEPIDDGFACGSKIPNNGWFFQQRLFQPRPDFIVKNGGPRTTDRNPRAYLIGDVKLSGNAVVSKIGSNQWQAITGYAKRENRHQYVPNITFWGLTDKETAKLDKAAAEAGILARAVSVLSKSRNS